MILFYISGHGFGHASRQIEVINALRARDASLPVVVRTSAPRWLFDLTLSHPVDFREGPCDTGVAQIDSLTLDAHATIEGAGAFHRNLPERARVEAEGLGRPLPRLVIGDIPPLAFTVAHEIGTPSIGIANFTWDWIYEGYAEWLDREPELLAAIRAAYALADRAWRLPMAGGFAAFRRVEPLPFIARRSRRAGIDTRRLLGLPLDRALVFTSFGGYGLRQLAAAALPDRRPFVVVTTESARFGAASSAPPPGVIQLDEDRDVYAHGLRYEDLIAAVDVVVTKPGYGIISECIANDTALIYTSRGQFVEYDLLVREMPRYLRCAFLPQEDLIAGRWDAAVTEVLAQPPPPERPPVNGAEVAAEQILNRFA